MATLKSKKRTRTMLVKFMNELLDGEIKDVMDNYDPTRNNEETFMILRSHKDLLEKKFIKFQELSELIGEQIEKDEEFENDSKMVQENEIQFRKKLTFLNVFIEKHRNSSSDSSSKNLAKGAPVKLPKFIIKNFNGDPTDWQSFKESFEESIDKNKTLSDIEKMNYLIGYLTGEAEKCLKGLKLSNENYKIAKDMLEKRFGNPQIIISSHVRKLLSVSAVTSVKNVKGLRSLFDNIETEVRSLASIGCDSATYGTMLIPIIMDKLPEEIKLALSLEFGNNVWDLNKLLEVFRKELEAREKFSKSTEKDDLHDELEFSGQALYSGKSGYNKSKTRDNQKYRQDERNSDKTEQKLLCVFCRRDHASKNCDIITKPEIRKHILMKEKRCFVCMKSGHSANSCRLNWTCMKCGGKHNNAICVYQNKKSDSEEKFENKKGGEHSQNVNTQLNIFTKNTVLLQTARGKVASVNEKHCENLRMLLDSGSQQTYISPEARKRLNLKTLRKRTIHIKTFGNQSERKILDEVEFTIKDINGNYNIYITALVSDICHSVEDQAVNFAQSKYAHLQGLTLADNNPEALPMKIDILIGSNDYWNIVGTKQIRGDSGPVALHSALGYILSGPIEGVACRNSANSNFVSTHYLRVVAEETESVRELKQNFKKCFQNYENKMSEEDLDVVKMFDENTKFEDNRYEVKFPFKENAEILGDNFDTCKKRLSGLFHKFKTDKTLLQDYSKIINEQNNLQIIEEVENYSVGQTHYLPHRPVKREDKQSTPIRIVFDASCNSRKGGPSLNDVLYSGPSMTPLLRDVLLRLRSFNYVVSADIEKAFLQIGLFKDHKDFVRFLWFKEPDNLDFSNFYNNELIEYRFNRLLFGVNSSPFLLQATLRKHIMEHSDKELNKQKLVEGLHVDDLTTGANTIEEGKLFYERCKECLQDGGFNLRKFKSNSKEMEKQIYESFPDDQTFSNEQKILGLTWDKESDTIRHDFHEILSKFTDIPTKRTVLQSMASVFDPLGLLAPVTVKLKMFFQNICDEKFGWDDELNENLYDKWKTLLNEMSEVQSLNINRKYCFNDLSNPITNVQLHAFSDASGNIYASAVYLRFTMQSGLVKTSLVASRNRIISSKAKESKKMTVPRAELNGVLLMSELVPSIINALKTVYYFEKIIYWTDSAVVHAWVNSENKSFDNYTQTRLDKIRTVINDFVEFKLIPSKMNPADIATRGLRPSLLCESKLWLRGPDFLLLQEEMWPHLKNGDNFSSYIVEEKEENEGNSTRITSASNDTIVERLSTGLKSTSLLIGTVSEYNISSIIKINKFSSLKKLLRVTAWVIRFCKKIKNVIRRSKKKEDELKVNDKKENSKKLENTLLALEAEEKTLLALEAEENTLLALEAEENTLLALEAEENTLLALEAEENTLRALEAKEITKARWLWVKNVQQEIANDKNFLQIKSQLKLFLDNGLWRCGGRIANSELSYDTKHPLIIPRKHYFAMLIMKESHENVLHNGVRETLNDIRQQYWITKPRTLVKRVIKECLTCQRHEGLPYSYPEEGPLPKERVTSDFAFSFIGVDLAGPIFVKPIYETNDMEMNKAWIVVITCANSRCIYLDLVPDCSGPTFIDTLKRFISTHGAPKVVISDNGKNFISKEVQNFATTRGIKWKFNIESAPWTGGFFERVVKMVKRCLRKILGKSRLNYNEILTLLKEIQNVLNNRPLTYVYDDGFTDPLTPNKLLFGHSIDHNTNYTDETNTNDIELSERLDSVQKKLEQFWTRWSNEYLTALRERDRTKINNNEIRPRVNDVVIIKQDNVKRPMWRIGKIERLIKSRDGQTRAAEVAVFTNNHLNILKRPINRLFPMEIPKKYSPQEPDIKFIDESHLVGGGGV